VGEAKEEEGADNEASKDCGEGAVVTHALSESLWAWRQPKLDGSELKEVSLWMRGRSSAILWVLRGVEGWADSSENSEDGADDEEENTGSMELEDEADESGAGWCEWDNSAGGAVPCLSLCDAKWSVVASEPEDDDEAAATWLCDDVECGRRSACKEDSTSGDEPKEREGSVSIGATEDWKAESMEEPLEKVAESEELADDDDDDDDPAAAEDSEAALDEAGPVGGGTPCIAAASSEGERWE